MIDLHTHSLFSDGELIPSELVRRLEKLNYSAVAITDHADSSNMDHIIPRIALVADDLNKAQSVKIIPGIELTHIPPSMIGTLVKKAKELGAKLVIVHGETIVEPVAPGTNRAALEADVDILAHPGLITEEDAMIASEKGTFLEISGRAGHSLCNGHVAKMADKFEVKMIFGSDAHSPYDFMTKKFAEKVVEGAGMPAGSLTNLMSNARQLLGKKGVHL